MEDGEAVGDELNRISLIDVDSKIPNLALMKISAFHKAQGDIVGFDLPNPDKIYASIIFRRKKGFALNNRLDKIPFEIGGSGFSLDSCLPLTMEFLKPDYDLYPSEYSQGFSTRGCNRKCVFCIVWKKEGSFISGYQHPEEFYDDQFKEMMLMDNNILFDKRWTKKVLSWALDQGVKINMTQGYDIRLLDEKIAGLILQSNTRMIRFAFDDSKLSLDPFCGTGTACLVARKLNRHFIGFELNPDYVKMANRRLKKIPERLEKFI